MGAYDDTLAYLTGLEVSAGWDLKLERMAAALARRGHPEARFPAVHIAGTNGKGSAAAMVDSVLTAAGYRTGLYTSPHLVDFTERIRAGGRTIPRADVVALVGELRSDIEAAGIALTHFEFVTLLACEWFARLGDHLHRDRPRGISRPRSRLHRGREGRDREAGRPTRDRRVARRS